MPYSRRMSELQYLHEPACHTLVGCLAYTLGSSAVQVTMDLHMTCEICVWKM